tara:strand:+ start:2513 stop:4582 length:2070 start_codon:yes stop_codon:yes gene_type:complete
MANTFTSRDTLKTKLLAAVTSATTADQIVKLSRSIEKANLDDDADLETALDTKVSAMADSASTEDIEKLAFGVKKLRTPAAAAAPTSTQVAEGSSNLYVTDSRVRSSFSASGDLSYDSGTGVLSYTALPDALTVYATVGDLPSSGVAAGAKGIVEENKKLYVFTGASWVGVGLVDQKPSFTTTPNGSYALSPGADTVITLAATDPQGDPITYSHQVTAGSLGGTTVSQADNVFTISASSNSADAGSFSLSFTASDGTNLATTTPSEFTLAFGFNWDSIDVYNKSGPFSVGSALTYYGKTIASTEDNIIVSAPRAYNDGNIKICDVNLGVMSQIHSTLDNRHTYNPTHGAWYWCAHEWMAADGDYVTFKSRANGQVVDVWDISNPYGATLHKCIRPQDFNVDQTDIDRTSNSWGNSGDIKGNYLVIGDPSYRGIPSVNPGYPYPGQPGHGKLWVFDISTGGITDPTLLYSLQEPNGSSFSQESNAFSASISVSSSGLMAVSSPSYLISGQGYGGRVYIFNIADGSFVKHIDISMQDILPSNSSGRQPASHQNMMKLSDDGSTLAVGDKQALTAGNAKGIVSVYNVSDGSRKHIVKAQTYMSEANTQWGGQVDLSSDGEYLLFSAIDAGNNDEGKVYFSKTDGTNFTGGPNTWELGSGDGNVSAYGDAVHFTSNKIIVGSAPAKAVWRYQA